MTSVKEQTAGLYAKGLSEAGFIALTFDAAYQGESEGVPRYMEDPYQRVEDVKSAVTYLSTLENVDADRIGALGICASGGYVPFAAQTDLRIKTVSNVSAACTGKLTREGLKNVAPTTRDALFNNLKTANSLRTAEGKGENPAVYQLVADSETELPEGIGKRTMFYEAVDYFKRRACHERSPNKVLVRSCDLLANYDSYNFIDLISPRPLLMIVGSDADTKYFSENAINQAKEPKELYEIAGKTHIGIYDDLTESLPKLISFHEKNLAA